MWTAIILSGAGFLVWKLTRTTSVFISYDYDNDRHVRQLLGAWSANNSIDFSFADQSADISINSRDEGAIKRAISRKIRSADKFLVVIGRETCRCPMVCWEIQKARDLGKRIIAVKLDRRFESPREVLNTGATWIYGIQRDQIVEMIL